jgi:hypothetical protein
VTLMTTKTVGFDRVIRRFDLDRALELAQEQVEVETARKQLDEMLKETISSASSREKTAGILRSIWLDPPPQCLALRDEALAIDEGLQIGSFGQLALHWGMAMAAYPFVGTVAETTGRLLRLQETVSVSGIRRRVQESYGDRPTVNKAVPCVLRSFSDWDVLDDVDGNRFRTVKASEVTSARLAGWLLEATLHTRRTEADDFQTLLSSPQLFPFTLSVHSADELPSSDRRMIQRQGRGREVLVLG